MDYLHLACKLTRVSVVSPMDMVRPHHYMSVLLRMWIVAGLHVWHSKFEEPPRQCFHCNWEDCSTEMKSALMLAFGCWP